MYIGMERKGKSVGFSACSNVRRRFVGRVVKRSANDATQLNFRSISNEKVSEHVSGVGARPFRLLHFRSRRERPPG